MIGEIFEPAENWAGNDRNRRPNTGSVIRYRNSAHPPGNETGIAACS